MTPQNVCILLKGSAHLALSLTLKNTRNPLTGTLANSEAPSHEKGFIQASMSKIQGLLKASPTVFKDCKVNEDTDLSVKILLRNALLRLWRH